MPWLGGCVDTTTQAIMITSHFRCQDEFKGVRLPGCVPARCPGVVLCLTSSMRSLGRANPICRSVRPGVQGSLPSAGFYCGYSSSLIFPRVPESTGQGPPPSRTAAPMVGPSSSSCGARGVRFARAVLTCRTEMRGNRKLAVVCRVIGMSRLALCFAELILSVAASAKSSDLTEASLTRLVF